MTKRTILHAATCFLIAAGTLLSHGCAYEDDGATYGATESELGSGSGSGARSGLPAGYVTTCTPTTTRTLYWTPSCPFASTTGNMYTTASGTTYYECECVLLQAGAPCGGSAALATIYATWAKYGATALSMTIAFVDGSTAQQQVKTLGPVIASGTVGPIALTRCNAASVKPVVQAGLTAASDAVHQLANDATVAYSLRRYLQSETGLAAVNRDNIARLTTIVNAYETKLQSASDTRLYLESSLNRVNQVIANP